MLSSIPLKNSILFTSILFTIYISIITCNNVNHEEIFQNGIQAVENNDYSQSIIFFKQYIQLEPNDIQGFINISNAYYQTDQLENATEYISKALKIDPENLDALKIQKNIIYSNAQKSLKNNDYNQSVIFFKQYIQLEPNDIQGFINISQAYYQTDQLENATEYIAKALKIDPENLDALKIQKNITNKYIENGNEYAINADFKKAIKSFLKYSELEPNDIQGFINISQAYYQTDELENASEYISKALKIDPDYSPAIEIKNLILNAILRKSMMNNTTYQEAIIFFEKFINSNPNDIQGFIAIASAIYQQSYSEINDINKKNNSDTAATTAKSLEYIAKALKIDPENTEILSLKNQVENSYFIMGYKEIHTNNDFKKAIEYFEQYIKLEPNDINRFIDITSAIYQQSYSEINDINKKNNSDTAATTAKSLEYIAKALKIDPENTAILSLKNQVENLYFSMGSKEIHTNNDFKKAIEYFEQYIKLKPNDIQGFINISNAYYHTDQFETANEYIAKALEIDSSNAEALYLQKNSLYSIVQKSVDNNDFKKAIEYFEQYIKLGPNDINGLINISNTYYQIDQLENATEYIAKALEIDPENSDALKIRKNIIYSNAQKSVDNNDFKKAIEYFEQYIKLEPNDINGLINISNAYYQTDQLENATEYIAKALEIDSSNPGALYLQKNIKNQYAKLLNQGLKYFDENQFDESIGIFKQYINYDNTNIKILVKLGVAHKHMKLYDQALEYFSQAINLDETHSDAYLQIAIIANINENYSNALQNLKLADNYNRNNPEIYFEKAKSYWNLNDLENAITNFDKVIELSDPEKSIYQTSLNLKNQAISKQNQLNPPTIYINVNDAIVYFSRGVDNQIIGDDEKAIEYFNSALEIDPNYRDAYFSRGVSYKNIGNYTKAIEDFNSALEIDPNFFPAIIEKNSISS